MDEYMAAPETVTIGHQTKNHVNKKTFNKYPFGFYCDIAGCGGIAYATCHYDYNAGICWSWKGCGKKLCPDHIIVRYHDG